MQGSYRAGFIFQGGIRLEIFENTGRKNLFLYIVIAILIIFALYLVLPTVNPLFFFIPLSIFLIILTIFEPKETPVGTIYLKEYQIIIKTNQANVVSELPMIRKLELKYSGFKGKRLPADYFPRFNRFSGNDNCIGIDLGTEVFTFRFLVEDEIKEKQLIELVRNWEKTGFDVSNISLNI